MDYSQIDKAPEEKARGITISTAVGSSRKVLADLAACRVRDALETLRPHRLSGSR
jgi:hypothetical protein